MGGWVLGGMESWGEWSVGVMSLNKDMRLLLSDNSTSWRRPPPGRDGAM
jgi:hypothetical protein